MIRSKLLLAAAVAALSCCNQPIEVRVNDQADPPAGVAISRGFNLLIPPGPYRVDRIDVDFGTWYGTWYGVPMQLYLRPTGVDSSAVFQIEFKSSTYGYLQIAGDRLFPGDKATVPYALFKDYRLNVRFATPLEGSHQLTVTAVNGREQRSAQAVVIIP